MASTSTPSLSTSVASLSSSSHPTQSTSDVAISDVSTNRQCVEQSLSDFHQVNAESSSFSDVVRVHCDEEPLSVEDCDDSMNHIGQQVIQRGILVRLSLEMCSMIRKTGPKKCLFAIGSFHFLFIISHCTS